MTGRLGKITITLVMALCTAAAAFAAGNVEFVSQKAINASGSVVARLLNGSYTIEAELKNNTSEAREMTVIVVTMAGDVCKGVSIGQGTSISPLASGTSSAPCTVSAGVDSVKCIAAEIVNNALYPASQTVKTFTKRGWN